MPKRTFHRLDDDKKERIMRATIEEFHRHGFETTKIETIAQSAGVAKGSIYQYFEDKKELFLYTISWGLEYFMTLIDRQTPLKDMDVYDYFLSGSRERFELVKKEPLLVAFFVDISSGKYGSLTEVTNKELKRIADEHELKLIRKGQEKGTVRNDMDDSVLLLFFQGVTEKFTMELMARAKCFEYEPTQEQFYELEDLLKDMVSLLKQGMGR